MVQVMKPYSFKNT